MKQRIQKILGSAGVASRRNIEEMIRQGRVAVNGKIVIELPVLIDPEVDRIKIDGEPVHGLAEKRAAPRLYILLNKPKGVFSTNVAQGEQTRAVDLLPPNLPGRVYPVGRLDAEAKGLLLLTNDGELTNQLTHPRYGVTKTYRAVVDGFITGDTLQQLSHGVWLGDPSKGGGFKTGRAQMKVVSRSRTMSVLEITLREARNMQVRRMLARVGHKVRDLTRIKFGPLTLQGLSLGESRGLTAKEVKMLRSAVMPKEPEKQSAPGKRATTE
jgi:23S rRNA pseudouridine2605 synthase